MDISAEAVRLTQDRGVVALRRDVFAPLPGEGGGRTPCSSTATSASAAIRSGCCVGAAP
ncbi:hypothetical protein NKG94_01790 [Micromonospora sp. M12]